VGTSRVAASKDGQNVVFLIDNGGRSHYVRKSSVPNDFGPSLTVRVKDGTYADPISGGQGIVFYRFD
jgi:hypothetical protein